jgi:hypothetical protein
VLKLAGRVTVSGMKKAAQSICNSRSFTSEIFSSMTSILIATKPWLPALLATALGAIDWASASSSRTLCSLADETHDPDEY